MSQTFYEEPARQIPVVGSYDVIVAGGGPAGIGAAIAAAKNGAKTLLLEQTAQLGGMAIPGMMSHWGGKSGNSITRELITRAGNNPWENEQTTPPHAINHEKQRLILFEMMEEAGVTVQLHTFVSGVRKEGKRITGIITESKSGRELVECKVVIDCTGDGDVAALAGAEFQLGREGDSKMQPVTLMFKLAGVDWERCILPGSFESYMDVPKGEIQSLGKSILPHPAGHVLLYASTMPGTIVVNMTNVINIDGTNVRDLTRAEIICQKQIPEIVKFLREYAPGYEHCYVIAVANYVGVRETRHVKGLYTITAEDIVEGRVFEDWIATRCSFNFDIHNIEGAGLDKDGAQKHFQSKGPYTVPYRACVPVEVEGLLLAGRCISGTHKAHSNFRIMSVCTGVGQGCGTAAAIAVRDGVSERDVDIKKVQEQLIADGIDL